MPDEGIPDYATGQSILSTVYRTGLQMMSENERRLMLPEVTSGLAYPSATWKTYYGTEMVSDKVPQHIAERHTYAVQSTNSNAICPPGGRHALGSRASFKLLA